MMQRALVALQLLGSVCKGHNATLFRQETATFLQVLAPVKAHAPAAEGAPAAVLAQSQAELNAASLDFGSIECMRWTGGSCSVFKCSEHRGETSCEQGYCMCAADHCSSSVGVCEPSRAKDIGSHAIKFTQARDQQQSYVRAAPVAVNILDRLFGGDGDEARRNGVKFVLDSSGKSDPYWKVVLTNDGYVRMESLEEPGQILGVYQNRRRRSSEDNGAASGINVGGMHVDVGAAKRLHSAAGGGGGSDADAWPVLRSLSQSTPLEATFRVRETEEDGGGYEIWDPDAQVALSTVAGAWAGWMQRSSWDVTVCTAGFWGFGGCKGRQLVQFEPALPLEATPKAPRDHLTGISSVNWLQVLGIAVCAVGMIVAVGLTMASMASK